MISAINNAAGGLSRAQAAAETAAQGVSESVAVDDVTGELATLPGGVDLVRQMVALKLSEVSYSANAAVIRAVDRMNEEMLDLLA
ncbi:MAG: hypothetical protein HZA51_13715 [Planctomycetes bacterium]|nr:hypothetical protein [Planctomycetota bacterium]